MWDGETKLHVTILYLDQECWKWWQWYHKCYTGKPTLNMFSKAICACFEKEYHFLGNLTKLKRRVQYETTSRHLKNWLSRLRVQGTPSVDMFMLPLMSPIVSHELMCPYASYWVFSILFYGFHDDVKCCHSLKRFVEQFSWCNKASSKVELQLC